MLADFFRLTDRVPDWTAGGALTLLSGALLWWRPGFWTLIALMLALVMLALSLQGPPDGPG